MTGAGGCASTTVDRVDEPGPAVIAAAEDVSLHEFNRVRMGVPARLLIYSESAEQAEAAARAAFDRISELESVLSDYDSSSEVRRLAPVSVGEPVEVSIDLAAAVRRSTDVSAMTYGAFDASCGPLTQLWRQAFLDGEPPDDAAINAAASRVGWSFISVEEDPPRLIFDLPGMALDFGGIGKGIAADAALEVLRLQGCPRSLVDLGGDLAIGAPPPGRSGWRIGVALDDDSVASHVELAQCGVATSGNAEQHMDHGGNRHSHIIDPRTGFALKHSYAVSVQAPDATTADAMASAISVLGPVVGPSLLEVWPDIHILSQGVTPP